LKELIRKIVTLEVARWQHYAVYIFLDVEEQPGNTIHSYIEAGDEK
jgi:hypothetical protein